MEFLVFHFEPIASHPLKGYLLCTFSWGLGKFPPWSLSFPSWTDIAFWCDLDVRRSIPLVFVALCWTLSMSVPSWGALNWARHSTCASPVLTRGGESPPSACWGCSSQGSPESCCPSLLEGCFAGSCSAQCPPGPPNPFLPQCFPVFWLPACFGAWGCSFSGKGPAFLFEHQQ